MTHKAEEICSRCGKGKSEHVEIHIPKRPEVWLCPTALFSSQTEQDKALQDLVDEA